MLKFSRMGSEPATTVSSRESTPSPASYTPAYSEPEGLLSEDVELKGTLHFSKALELNCKFQGELNADGPLTIGPQAVVKGEIKASSNVVVQGKIQGNIVAEGTVELKSQALLIGDVTCTTLIIQQGAVFSGCSHNSKASDLSSAFGSLFQHLD